MTTTNKNPTKERRSRKIIGFSLPPELAGEVKAEAARRKILLRNLFVDMWQLYKRSRSPSG